MSRESEFHDFVVARRSTERKIVVGLPLLVGIGLALGAAARLIRRRKS